MPAKLTKSQVKALNDFAQSDPANGKFASCALTTARALRNKGLLELNADRRCVITDAGRAALPTLTDDEKRRRQIFTLELKIKIAAKDKERTARKLQDAWDADNAAADKLAMLETQLNNLKGNQ